MTDFTTSHRFMTVDARDLGGAGLPSSCCQGGTGTDDGMVDLVVSSPPYPMIAMWDDCFAQMDPDIHPALAAGRGQLAWELMHRQLDRVWEGLVRLVRPGGWVCLNMGDAVRTLGGEFRIWSNHARLEAAMLRLGFQVLPPVIWRKPSNSPTKFMGSGMLPGGAYVTLEHEFVLIFRKPRTGGGEGAGTRRLAVGTDAAGTGKADRREIRRQSALFWEERNSWFTDLWTLPGCRQHLEAGGRERSGAYPVELPFRLIAMYSSYGDTVLDPFSGTGTTALAAMALGRSSLGLEIQEGLNTLAQRRLEASLDWSRRRIGQRLEDHRDFLAGRPEPRHYNAGLNLGVVTGQEEDLRLWLPESLAETPDGRLEASYRDLAAVRSGAVLKAGSLEKAV